MYSPEADNKESGEIIILNQDLALAHFSHFKIIFKHSIYIYHRYILVAFCLYSYNKMPQTKWLIYNQNLFLPVYETEKSKIKMLADLVSDESLISGSHKQFLTISSHGRGASELCQASFIKVIMVVGSTS
jgi:hypothetical protein